MQHTALRAHVKAHIVPLCLDCSASGSLSWHSGCIRLQCLYTFLQAANQASCAWSFHSRPARWPTRDQPASPEESGQSSQTTTWHAHREEQSSRTIQVKSKTNSNMNMLWSSAAGFFIWQCHLLWPLGSSIIGSSLYLSSRQIPKGCQKEHCLPDCGTSFHNSVTQQKAQHPVPRKGKASGIYIPLLAYLTAARAVQSV